MMGAFSHFADLGTQGGPSSSISLFPGEGGAAGSGRNGDPPAAHFGQRCPRAVSPSTGWTGCASAGGCTWTIPPAHRTGEETATWRTWITSLAYPPGGRAPGLRRKHFWMPRDATVATIAVGYGDGLSDRAGTGPWAGAGRRRAGPPDGLLHGSDSWWMSPGSPAGWAIR